MSFGRLQNPTAKLLRGKSVIIEKKGVVMTLRVDPKYSFKIDLSEDFAKLVGRAEVIKEIIGSLDKEEIIKNQDELLSFAKSLEELLDKLSIQKSKKAKELMELVDEIIELIIEPLEDEWLLNRLQGSDSDTVSFEDVLEELNR